MTPQYSFGTHNRNINGESMINSLWPEADNSRRRTFLLHALLRRLGPLLCSVKLSSSIQSCLAKFNFTGISLVAHFTPVSVSGFCLRIVRLIIFKITVMQYSDDQMCCLNVEFQQCVKSFSIFPLINIIRSPKSILPIDMTEMYNRFILDASIDT